MRDWNNGDNWELARTVRNVARNLKANPAYIDDDVLGIFRDFVSYFCAIGIPEASSGSSGASGSDEEPKYEITGTRPWLAQRMLDKAVTGNYSFDIANEPFNTVVRAVEIIARDLIAVPLSDEEAASVEEMRDMMLADEGLACLPLGTAPGYGAVAGSIPTPETSSESSEESSESSEESSESSEESSESSGESSSSPEIPG